MLHNTPIISKGNISLDSQTPVSNIIILSDRDQVVSALRTELKKFSFDHQTIFASGKPIECKEEITKAETPFLIVDWDSDIQRVMLLLQSMQTKHRYEQIPIYLLASTDSDELLHAAAEYGISKLKIGELSPLELKADLKNQFDEISTITPIKKLLTKIYNAKSQSDWSAAIKAIEESEESSQKVDRIVIEWADALMQLKKWDEAEERLSSIMTDEQKNPRAIHMYGTCLIKTGDMDGATGQMRKAKNLSPFNPDRLVDLGNALIHLGEYDEADQNFGEAKALSPTNKGATKGLGKVKLMIGKVNEALELLSEIQNKQEIASVFNSAAIISIKKGHHDDGLKLYGAAITALESDTKVAAKLYYNKGIGFMHAKRMKDAHDSFQNAVSLDPEYEDAKHNLEVMEGKKGKKSKKTDTAPEAQSTPPASNTKTISDQEKHDDKSEVQDLEPEGIDDSDETIGSNDLDLSNGGDDDDDDLIDS